MGLIFNMFPYYVSSDFITYTPDKISLTLKLPRPQLFLQALFRQAPLPRLTASHFPPASKLAGIQWRFL